jgi:uncharacterized protein YdcH (DUF465 family)
LEEWKQQHIQETDSLKEKLKKANENGAELKKENLQLKGEMCRFFEINISR